MLEVLGTAAVAVVVAYLLFERYTDKTKMSLQALDYLRIVFFGGLLVMLAIGFLSSGSAGLIVVGFVIVLFLGLSALNMYDESDVGGGFR